MLTRTFGDERAANAIIRGAMAQTERQNVNCQGAAKKAVLGGPTCSECQ